MSEVSIASCSALRCWEDLTDGVEPASLGAALPCRLLDLGVLGDDMSLGQPNLQILQIFQMET